MLDLVIKGGRVVDGTGAPWFRADVGIEGDRIAAIGRLDGVAARRTVDAKDRLVTPGLIDAHTHSDLTIAIEPRASSAVTQGVTTQVAGNCGVSAAPTIAGKPYYGPLDPTLTDGLGCDWTGFAGYFERLERQGVATNIASFVGHGNVRASAMGYDDRAPTEAEMVRMEELTEEAMQDGAIGMTTGLAYIPGSYAKSEEIVRLARVVARHGGLYASHIRNQTESIVASVRECLDVGRQAGIPGSGPTPQKPLVDSGVRGVLDATTGSPGAPTNADPSQPPIIQADGGVVVADPQADPVHFPELQPMLIGKPALLANGFTLVESPTWDPCGQRLIVADPSQNTISEIAVDGTVSKLVGDAHYTNGMAYDRDGTLLMAQMGNGAGGRIARLDRAGNSSVLVDKNTKGGVFHTVDDLTVRSDGTIYFTDGDYSHAQYTAPLTATLASLPLYILKPGPDPRELLLGPSVGGPNGLELSLDERTLFLNAYFGDAVGAYPVLPDGTLGKGAVLAANIDKADSLCLDLVGNLYVGMDGGLQILRPDGSRLHKIPIMWADKVTNCTFGGPDGRTLFITAWTDVWKVENMPIPGLDWKLNQRIDCGPPLTAGAPGVPATFAPLPPGRP